MSDFLRANLARRELALKMKRIVWKMSSNSVLARMEELFVQHPLIVSVAFVAALSCRYNAETSIPATLQRVCDIHTHHPIIPQDGTTHDDDVGYVVYGFPLGRWGVGRRG